MFIFICRQNLLTYLLATTPKYLLATTLSEKSPRPGQLLWPLLFGCNEYLKKKLEALYRYICS